jgi:4-alpha-glucanotransferase
MARLSVPGCKVLRWERHYHSHDRAFVDPAAFPAVSVAMTGTHDTETLAAWWDHAPDDERRAFLALRPLRAGAMPDEAPWSDALRDQILDVAYRSGSAHVFLPLQDVFGWRDRINTPATINDGNWTWRLPWPVDALTTSREAAERAAFCRQLAVASSRGAVELG